VSPSKRGSFEIALLFSFWRKTNNVFKNRFNYHSRVSPLGGGLRGRIIRTVYLGSGRKLIMYPKIDSTIAHVSPP